MDKFRSYVKYGYRIIDRLISIKVLWKSFYFNTPNQKVNSRLHLLSFKPHTLSSSSFLIILSCLYILWIKACRLITYLGFKATHQVLNYSRTVLKWDHCQTWLFRVTCQDLQPSSHNSGITITCWCQPFVI